MPAGVTRHAFGQTNVIGALIRQGRAYYGMIDQMARLGNDIPCDVTGKADAEVFF
jgi:hypothetical protein